MFTSNWRNHCSAKQLISMWQRLCPDGITPQERAANCPECSKSSSRVNCVHAESLSDVLGDCRQKVPVRSCRINPQHYFIAWGLSHNTIWGWALSMSNSTADWRADTAGYMIIITVHCATPVAQTAQPVTIFKSKYWYALLAYQPSLLLAAFLKYTGHLIIKALRGGLDHSPQVFCPFVYANSFSSLKIDFLENSFQGEVTLKCSHVKL